MDKRGLTFANVFTLLLVRLLALSSLDERLNRTQHCVDVCLQLSGEVGAEGRLGL